MRGCRGGVSPCAGMSRHPRRNRKDKEKRNRKSASFRAGCPAACNGNGMVDQLHGNAPAETDQGVKPLARVQGRRKPLRRDVAAARAQYDATVKRKRSASVRAGDEVRLRLKRQVPQPARGAASSDLAALGHLPQRERLSTHSTKARADKQRRCSINTASPFAMNRATRLSAEPPRSSPAPVRCRQPGVRRGARQSAAPGQPRSTQGP